MWGRRDVNDDAVLLQQATHALSHEPSSSVSLQGNASARACGTVAHQPAPAKRDTPPPLHHECGGVPLKLIVRLQPAHALPC